VKISRATERHFGIHENAVDITQNVLIPQILEDFAPKTPSGDSLPPAHPLGAQPPDPCFAPPSWYELLGPPLVDCGLVVGPRNDAVSGDLHGRS